jgi:SAM-dependent methyltransferase
MQSAPVQQLAVLAELFGKVLGSRRPESVAILGLAGGNGLEHIDPAVTHRVCGFDINPEYLEAARQRYAGLEGLELHCVDLAEHDGPLAPVELVHAALIFEHAGTEHCLENAVKMVAPGGALSVVLQLPSTTPEAVPPPAHPSVETLRRHFQFIDPDILTQRIEARGFRLTHADRLPLASGKSFWTGLFEKLKA